MDLPHPDRHRWIKVISEINRKINAVGEEAPGFSGEGQPQQPPQLSRGQSGVSRGLALRSDPAELNRILRERAARLAREREERASPLRGA